jgi:hypothetical protein
MVFSKKRFIAIDGQIFCIDVTRGALKLNKNGEFEKIPSVQTKTFAVDDEPVFDSMGRFKTTKRQRL